MCNLSKLWLRVAPMLLLVLSCCSNSSNSSSNEIETIILKDYQTVVDVEDNILAVPSIIKYHNSSLFIYDKSQSQVLELNKNGALKHTFGRSGRGPGEFMKVRNIFLTDSSLYAVDTRQYYIHKYDLNGDFISSMDYGKAGGFGRPNVPPAPISRSFMLPENINNQPVVTRHGNVLLSSVQFSDSVQTIYELMDWQGKHLADIGNLPQGSSIILDNNQMKEDVENREIPSFYRANTFPVPDKLNPGQFFLIYTAFPKILKYNSKGEKLWESAISDVAEIDSIRNHFYETMKQMQQTDIRNRISLDYYTAGVNSPNGNLYLIMDSQPLQIHKFNPDGDLVYKYNLTTNDINILPIFDIDFTEKRIFVVTEEGEIRAYPFE